LSNAKGFNAAAGTMMAVMRNFISLPKKNVLMSANNYVRFFKVTLKERMFEKCFTNRNIWHFKSIYDNITKVTLNHLLSQKADLTSAGLLKRAPSGAEGEEGEEDTVFVLQDRVYKSQLLSKLREKMSEAYPHLYIFDEMVKLIVRLNNQLHSIDHNCILVGRTGTGK
jgi:hypothetical protein